jgi:Icc-related predicted phosphoesterase
LGNEKNKRKFHRIFFATDLHASEIVFRRFISAASFYQADTLVMGGDVTGKTVVPLVEGLDGKFQFNFQGQEFTDVRAVDLAKYETQIANAGLYPHRVSKSDYENLRNDPAKVTELFDQLMADRLNHWTQLAEEKLAPLNVRCYWTGGNDDKQAVLDEVRSTEHFKNVDGQVVKLESGHEMLNLGWSNPTPWRTPRECSEEELAVKLGYLCQQVGQMPNCIFNVHVPPYDSSLDVAPKLDTSVEPPKPFIEGGQQVLVPVGSTAVRKEIEKSQPLLMLCGHIHETKNSSKIKRTTCIDPGSEYQAGILRGVIVNLLKDKVLSFQITSG